MTPIIKWPGGKRHQADALNLFVPEDLELYVEPMVGGGALFFHLADEVEPHPNFVLNDRSADLMSFYRDVQQDPSKLIAEYETLRNRAKDDPGAIFYEVRDAFNAEKEGKRNAAHFYYLKQNGFNGVMRYNKEGAFNVPWNKKQPVIMPKKSIKRGSNLLQGVRLSCLSYQSVLPAKSNKKTTLVYFDPPYMGTFDKYTRQGFTLEDHQDLIMVCRELAKQPNTTVVLQNSDMALLTIKRLWPEAFIYRVESPRPVNRSGKGRGNQPEIIASNREVSLERVVKGHL